MVTQKNEMEKNNLAVVFNIVHGSFVDGYGVRTTLFLKGCPLRCAWCCNPEGQNFYPQIKFTASKCDGCAECPDLCPVGAITLHQGEAENIIRIDRTLCNNCGECIAVCHTGALSFFGEQMPLDKVFSVLKKDERYYNSSGGGVTIGGGEPTFQPEFTYALMKKCQEHYIHVAIDTCGYTINNLGFRILAEADLLLYDIKGIEKKRHKVYTGVPNDTILSNLKKLSEMGKSIIIRIPLVPDYNDSEQDIRDTAEFLSKLKSIQRIDLLPYHKFGIVKYDQLGLTYGLPETPNNPDEYIDKVMNIFESYALKTQIGG